MSAYKDFRKDLDQFGKLAQKVLRLKAKGFGKDDLELVGKFAYGSVQTDLVHNDSNFAEWMGSYPSMLLDVVEAYRYTSRVFLNLYSVASHPDGVDEATLSKEIKQAQTTLEGFIRLINQALSLATPAKMTYGGFKILNPLQVPEPTLGQVLSAIDHINDVFRKRGLEKALTASVTHIQIVKQPVHQGAGWYQPKLQTITINVRSMGGTGRLWDREADYVLLHEIGHHVHLHELHPRAKAEWDSGWAEVDVARQEIKQKISVTHADRQRFFELIKKNSWDPQKAGSKMKGLDRLKYLSWLYNTAGNRVSSSPNQVRLTDYGRTVFEHLGALEHVRQTGYLDTLSKQEQDNISRQEKSYLSNLFLTDFYRSDDYPMISPEAQDEVRKQDKSVDEALSRLGIPSEYGKTNHMEDFAETFVLFVTNPSRLSEMARYRMSRALSLSGLYGKVIMPKLATRVAHRYLQALIVPPRRDREIAMYHSTIRQMKDMVQKVQKLEPALDKADKEGFLWDLGITDAGMPNIDFNRIFRRFENAVGKRRDKPLDDWDDDYLEDLKDVRYNIRYAVEDMQRDLRHWISTAQDLRTALSSPRYRESVSYYPNLTKADLDALRALPDMMMALPEAGETLLKRMDRINDPSSSDQIPASAQARDFEQLYHASINAKTLASKGFSSQIPESGGLGGSQMAGGGKKGISFTEDQYVAKEIARVLKEVVMIARGDVKGIQIMEWVRKTGKERQILDWYQRYYGDPRYGFGTPELAMGLYLSYMQFSGRYDPKFFGVGGPRGMVQNFKSVNPRNIGYIVATVDMSNPHITYGKGERELRVPPEAVVSVDRFIG
jgi:hypothetical protein